MSIWALLGQAVAMFVASFAVGYIPLGFKSALSGRPLKAISVFGMGLLVGAALTVIIPEGVTTLYESLPSGPDTKEGESDPTHTIGISLLAGFALMMLVESLTPHGGREDLTDEEDYSLVGEDESQLSNSADELPRFNFSAAQPHKPSDPHSDESTTYYASSAPGVAERQYPERLDSSTTLFNSNGGAKAKPKTFHTLSFQNGPNDGLRPPSSGRRHSRSEFGGSDQDRCQEAEGGASGKGVAGLNATLGLVIHAAADGIALGASSLSDSGNLGLVVFLAVIIHKGPTALGLTTTLLSLSLTPTEIRRRLFLFSIAAPLGAIVTYLLVYLFGGAVGGFRDNVKEVTDGIGWWTGVVLLFSGGSFLYVATVISPLSPSETHDSHGLPDGEELSKMSRLGLLMGGMILPLAMGYIAGGHDH